MSALQKWSTLVMITRKIRYPVLRQARSFCVRNRLFKTEYLWEKRTHLRYSQCNQNIIKSPHKDVPLPESRFTDYIWSKVENWPNHTALVCGVSGKEVKYFELREECKKFGVALLKHLGIKPGQVIATILPNILEYPPVILGALEAGIIVSPINPSFTADEIEKQIENCEAVLVVTFPSKLDDLKHLRAKMNNIFDIIVTGEPDQAHEGVIQYHHIIGSADPAQIEHLKPKSFSMDDTIIIPYSSGTTGVPKGVCLTHKNLIANTVALLASSELQDTTDTVQDVIPLVLPVFHIYGFAVVLTHALYSGCKVIMLPKFEEVTFLRALKDYEATVMCVAPPLVIYIGNSPSVTEEHLKSLRSIMSGAAPLGELDIKKCVAKSNCVTYKQGYGLTETSPVVCIGMRGKQQYASIGPPVVNTLVKVIDIETKQALGNNKEGELCVKGPQVMKGYFKNEKATDEVIDSDGWFHTGDVGYYDADGFFYITDRLKELIKVKGFQVPPAELESILRSHPDVADAGVIGVPHERHGETPVGFVQMKAGIRPDAQSLEKYLKEKVAKHKQISKFVFVESIPKSQAGKILRKDLRAMYKKNA